MAVGDRIPRELAQTALSGSITTIFTNKTSGGTFRTQLTQIFLVNTGASSRVITLYKNGVAATNQIANSITLAANASTIINTTLVFTDSQTFSAKQDTGTDVSITCEGVEEQLT